MTHATRWARVISAAEEISRNPEAARAQLETLLEHFERDVDPVDDFEGFAVRQLVSALVRAQPRTK
ncbi:MAG: hypothetical protein ACOZQL_34070 [Myxococcota bacterium]